MRHAEAGPTLPTPDDETAYDETRKLAGPRDAGPRRDLRAVLADGPGLGEEDLLDLYCNDQVDRWCEGVRIPAEAYLTLHPALTIDHERAFDLVYGEYVLRESLGESPTPEEYAWRFPQLAERFRRQLGLHQALRAEDLECRPDRGGDRRRPDDGDPDGEGMESAPEVPGYRIL